MLAEQSKPALAALIGRVSDFILLLDGEGVISHVEVGSDELPKSLGKNWKGRKLGDTLLGGDKASIGEALASAAEGGAERIDLTHRVEGLPEGLPVQYQIVASGDGGFLAAGTDLRPSASLRQQLVNAQVALEQDYWRLRQVETRYRRLFDMVGDGVLVLDAASLRVLEANPRANELLGDGDKGIVGKVFPRGFDEDANRSLQDLRAEIRAVGRAQLHSVRLEDGERRVDVSASFLRQAGEERFLLRLGLRDGSNVSADGATTVMPEVLREAPDAILLVDEDGRILAANRAYLELAQLVAEEQVLGHSADRWLGRSGVDVSVLLSNLREKAVVKLFSSTLMPQSGTPAQVEVSACRLDESDAAAYALFIRDVERRVAHDHPVASKLPNSIDQVTQRVGRVPLKELVRESTDLIEALCIETALEVTQDNRASAAELLGLSRQSLYAKLRRFNIGGDGQEDAVD